MKCDIDSCIVFILLVPIVHVYNLQCLSMSLFVCIFVSFFVSFSARLLENGSGAARGPEPPLKPHHKFFTDYETCSVTRKVKNSTVVETQQLTNIDEE